VHVLFALKSVASFVSLDRQQLTGGPVNIGQHQVLFRAGGYGAKLLIFNRHASRMQVISSQVHSTALPSLRMFIINGLGRSVKTAVSCSEQGDQISPLFHEDDQDAQAINLIILRGPRISCAACRAQNTSCGFPKREPGGGIQRGVQEIQGRRRLWSQVVKTANYQEDALSVPLLFADI
jgi:hypothetical protein